MKKIIIALTLALLSPVAFSVETNSTPEQSEASYTAAIEGRAADILKVLALADGVTAEKVHDVIIAQYRALKAWHDENDHKLQMAKNDTNAVTQIRASLKVVHEAFIAKLSENLAPLQLDQVKDKMTYNKVQVTYAAYCEIIPTLTEAQKAFILEALKMAREEAMDAGSADEKSSVFKKYKGRIANYLAKQGVNETRARKDWGAQQKAKAVTNSIIQK
jgi:hypothetical protein